MIKIDNKYVLRKKRGFTLVELLISLAIISIIITITTSLLIYNHRIFRKSDNLSQVQFDVRMASDYITYEIRNVSLISTTDTTLDMIDTAFLKSKYPLVDSVDFEIKDQSGKYLLAYTVGGKDLNSENDYELSTEVLLNNITSANVGSSDKIYYKHEVAP